MTDFAGTKSVTGTSYSYKSDRNGAHRLWAEPQSKESQPLMDERINDLPPASEITAWMAHGNCRAYAPAVFFPSDGVGVDRARKICKTCTVADT